MVDSPQSIQFKWEKSISSVFSFDKIDFAAQNKQIMWSHDK